MLDKLFCYLYKKQCSTKYAYQFLQYHRKNLRESQKNISAKILIYITSDVENCTEFTLLAHVH